MKNCIGILLMFVVLLPTKNVFGKNVWDKRTIIHDPHTNENPKDEGSRAMLGNCKWETIWEEEEFCFQSYCFNVLVPVDVFVCTQWVLKQEAIKAHVLCILLFLEYPYIIYIKNENFRTEKLTDFFLSESFSVERFCFNFYYCYCYYSWNIYLNEIHFWQPLFVNLL